MTQAVSPIRRAELVTLACLFALFGFMGYTAYGYSLSDSLGPGPGFFPFWLGALGLTFSAALFVQSWRGRSIGEGSQTMLPRGVGARRTIALLGGLVFVALTLQVLGFRLVMLVFTAGLLLALGVRRPVPIAIFALVSGFGLFHVFYYWLQVPLPTGVFGF